MIKRIDSIERDERTISIENKSYSIGYRLALFALLLDTAYRSFYLHESSWDLLGIVLMCGVVTTFYQLNHKILTKGWIKISVLALILSIIVAIIIITLQKSI